MSKFMMSQDQFLMRTSRENLSQVSLPASGGLPAFLALQMHHPAVCLYGPWHSPSYIDLALLYYSVTSSLLTRTARPYFQIRSSSEVLGIRTSTYAFMGRGAIRSIQTGLQDSFHQINHTVSWTSPLCPDKQMIQKKIK